MTDQVCNTVMLPAAELDELKRQLAECQAREAKYRHAISVWDNRYGDWYGMLTACLDMPQDDSALHEVVTQSKREALLPFAKREPSECSVLESQDYKSGYYWGQLQVRLEITRAMDEIKP